MVSATRNAGVNGWGLQALLWLTPWKSRTAIAPHVNDLPDDIRCDIGLAEDSRSGQRTGALKAIDLEIAGRMRAGSF